MPDQAVKDKDYLARLLAQNPSTDVQAGNKNMPQKDDKPKSMDTQERTKIGDLKLQITFEYYKQQREELNHLGQERSSLTLQLLIILGALAATFFQTNITLLKLGISVIVIFLGIIGLLLFRNIDRSMRAHVKRARAARKSLSFLEEFASSGGKFGTIHIYYVLMYAIIIVVGIFFGLSVLLP